MSNNESNSTLASILDKIGISKEEARFLIKELMADYLTTNCYLDISSSTNDSWDYGSESIYLDLSISLKDTTTHDEILSASTSECISSKNYNN